MTDRIPGSSWSNPIWHGKWRIYVGGEMPGENYAFVHDDRILGNWGETEPVSY